jgi:hypothetical protein
MQTVAALDRIMGINALEYANIIMTFDLYPDTRIYSVNITVNGFIPSVPPRALIAGAA